MSQHKQTGRNTRGTARMPATKLAHLQKRMAKQRYGGPVPKGRKGG